MAGMLGTIAGQVRLDVRQAVAAYATLRAQNARTVYALRGAGDSFMQMGKTSAVGGAAMVYAFARVVNAAGEFERKMDYFGAVSDTNAKQMDKLRQNTLDLAKDTIYSAGEIADGYVELGKAGVSAKQIMEGVGEAMANLGAAGDIPLAESGQIITSTIQQFDLAARDAVKVTDLLAGAANASIADITDIGVSLKYVGGVANAVGLTFEDTTTAISLLAKAGIRGSTAGTSLRQMLVSLGGATEPARKSLKELGIITEDGSNKFFTAEGKAKSLSQVFQILKNRTADLDDKTRLMHLRTIFNNRALSAASILTREGAEGFKKMNKEMTKVTAAEVASERLDNLSGDIEILRGNIETLMIEAGTPFQEVIRGWVRSLTKLVQAFADLDPKLQKFIVQFVGIAGVSLLAFGIFSMVLGVLLRMAAAALKLAAAIRYVWTFLKLVGAIITIVTGVAAGTIAAIIAAVLAVIGVLVLLYMKWGAFRDVVNAAGRAVMDYFINPIKNGIMAAIGFFQRLFTEPGKTADEIKRALAGAAEWIGEQFGKVGGLVSSAFGTARGAVSSFIDSVVAWFASLPGKLMGVISAFTSWLGEIFTFRNIGYAIGWLVGTMIAQFLNLLATIGVIAGQIFTAVGGWFEKLPGRVGYAIGFMVGTVIRLFIGLLTRVGPLAARLVSTVVRFVQQLPGKIGAFITNTAVRFWNGLLRMVAYARQAGPRIVAGIIIFLSQLPGKVWAFMVSTIAKLAAAIPRWVQNAREMAQGAVDAIRSKLSELPGVAWDAIGAAIGAFKSMISSAFNAAKEFGAGLWNGFKDGIGINSPSFIEKAMFAMNDNLKTETDLMSRRTAVIQGIGKKFATSDFGVGLSAQVSTMVATQAAGSTMSDLYTNRAVPVEVSGGAAAPTSDSSRVISGTLTLDPSGRAFISGVAEDVYDRFEGDNTRRGGMYND